MGLEIDIVADHGRVLLPVEVKSGATIAEDWIESVERWCALAGKAAQRAWIAYGGDRRQSRSAHEILPWHRIGDLISLV